MLEIRHLKKSYREDDIILDDINYIFEDNCKYIIRGKSGSGKSTLLNIISSLDTLYEGEVLIDKENIKKNDEQVNLILLNKIGLILQKDCFLEDYSVFDNIAMTINTKASNTYKLKLIKNYCKRFMLNNCLNKPLKKLSGGERARVKCIMALIKDPSIIIADEPTASLDNATKTIIIKEFEKLNNKTLIIVTHDEDFTIDRCVNLQIEDKKLKGAKPSNCESTNQYSLNKGVINLMHLLWLKIKTLRLTQRKNLPLILSILFSFFGISLSTFSGNLANLLLKKEVASIYNDNSVLVERDESKIIDDENKSILQEEWASFNLPYDTQYKYLTNFNDLFIDNNECYFEINNQKIIVPGYGANDFNNSINVKEANKDYKIYPNTSIKGSSLNHIIIGIDLITLTSIATSLNIAPQYKELGEFLRFNTLIMYLRVSNYEWEYKKEVPFFIDGIFYSSNPVIINFNYSLVEQLFEKSLLLPVTNLLESTPLYPWTIKKINYVLIKQDLIDMFIDYILFTCPYDNIWFNVLDNHVNTDYYRITIYKKSKINFTRQEIKQLLENNNGYLNLEKGYTFLGGGLLNGFVNPIFISKREHSLDYLEEITNSFVEGEAINVNMFPTIEGVLKGDISNYKDELNIQFSYSTNIISGKFPSNISEIGISNKLAAKLNIKIGEEISYKSFVEFVKIDKNNYYNQFSSGKLRVSGIFNEESMVLIHRPLWPLYFYSGRGNIESEKQSIKGFLVNFSSEKESLDYFHFFEKTFPSISFSMPFKEIKKDMDNIITFFNNIMLSLSIFTILISCVIIGLITYFNFNEIIKKVTFFSVLGYSKKQINKIVIVESLFIPLLCFVEISFLNFFIYLYYFEDESILIFLKPTSIILLLSTLLSLLTFYVCSRKLKEYNLAELITSAS